jgi:hypothetical protein
VSAMTSAMLVEPMPNEVDVTTLRLADILRRLEGRLRAQRQHFWAGWLASSRGRIEAGDGWGLKHLRRAFDGSGSLLDLDLGKEDRALLFEAQRLAGWLGETLEIEDGSFPWG